MESSHALASVIEVIRTLIGPEGCPWDRKQTPQSLCDYVVEEAFELVEAIRDDEPLEACEEVGDVMFLLLFISELFAARGDFSLAEALSANAAKMIRRHPHVFADLEVSDQAELLANWERIKREEKSEDGGRARIFASLPAGLPPLLRAYRIHSKAARAGFTWETDTDAFGQVEAELAEFRRAEAARDAAAMQEEFGDLLFTLVEYGRRKGIKANEALDFANRKFLGRFEKLEDAARASGRDVAEMSLAELDELWQEAKGRG